MGSPLLAVEDVRFRYARRGRWALDGLSFRADRGRILGIVGPNGSGKTSLFRLILGWARPVDGRILIDGRAPHVYRRSRGIGYTPEDVRFPGTLTAWEVGCYVARLARIPATEVEAAVGRLLKHLELRERAGDPIASLSHGYRQRVGLLAALLGDPELILLDEPANGLDPASIGVLRGLLRGLRCDGRAVLVSSHNLLELERVCDDILILSHGRPLGHIDRGRMGRAPEIFVVQLRPCGPGSIESVDAAGGIRLSADEMAFTSEDRARGFARAAASAGLAVEAIERRPSDLEFLFHSLIQGRPAAGGRDA